MAKKDIHVLPHDKGWASRKEGASRAGRVYKTQKQAQDAARQQAKRESVEVVTHRRDGKSANATAMGTIRIRRMTKSTRCEIGGG
jgi:hypothetical protein